MVTINDRNPKEFIADFICSFNDEIAHGDDDPAAVVDRYYTPDIVQHFDGHQMDREKLIAHVRPLRKNKPTSRVEVHEAIADGNRLAAHYTMYVHIRGKDLTIESGVFAEFAPDGRIRRQQIFFRDVPEDNADSGTQSAEAAPS
ncbi:nuclear transport factor 2 family protein [Nocardia speluncae]|uniref:Nuclear transport factor 2 family protein n=1 Tax=Nocardia speluncae TaxID=419477 RepID=A0A846XKZ1_9NOCA|nr:nuclear transport factor 2 family protein [Nocardia speluncae]NKY35326.1 nuclear transport factor 2 family protein [Nocardia speluncae]